MKQHKSLARARDAISRIEQRLSRGPAPKAESDWGGADVVITPVLPQARPGGFYPEPRYVVTPYASELSWLFEQLRDSFAEILDGMTKIEFYGRLANAANRYLRRSAQTDVNSLLSVVLHEASVMRDEMEAGEFIALPVAEGNTIWDDIVQEAETSGYLGPQETVEFLRSLEHKRDDA